MKFFRMMLLGAALVAGTASTAQIWVGQSYQARDWDRDRMQNSAAYQEGLREGMSDEQHGRQAISRPGRWGNDWDRQAYQQGYMQGYNSARQNGAYYGQDRDWDRNRGYANNGYYNNGYGNGMQIAQRYGYEDGVREGASDRQTGHSFRPTQDTGYRMATNGYQNVFGSREQYKQWYRQSYEQGYAQGYNGNGRGYRFFPR